MSKKQYIVKTIAKGRSRGGTSASVAASAVGGLTDPVLSELKALLSFIGYDKDNNAVYIKKDDAGNARNFYTFGGMASGGKASSGGGGSVVSWSQIQTSGTKIATITINGVTTDVYAPNGGGSALGVIAYTSLASLTSEEMDKVPTAWAAKKLQERIAALENAPAGGVTSITVNGGAAQTGAVALTIPTALSQLSADGSHRLVTDTQIEAWNGKQDAIGDLNTIRSQAAAGYTAYGWGNHANAGYAYASALNNYLPKTGGTISGNLDVLGAFYGAPNVDGERIAIDADGIWLDEQGRLGTNLISTFVNAGERTVQVGGYAERLIIMAESVTVLEAIDGAVTINDSDLFTNGANDIGSSSQPWGCIYAQKWYPNPGDSTHYIEYDTVNGSFKVNGNIYATGQVAAGGVGSSGGGGSVVSWSQIQTPGTKIATITINGTSTDVYAPNGGMTTLQPLSFASKTYDGTVARTITSSDITSILGYTPVSSFNGRTGAVSLLKADVENVLTGVITSHQHTLLNFKDERNDNPLPYATGFGRGIEYALRYNTVDGVSDGGTYHGTMTLYQWSDNSGGAAHQLAFTDNGNIYTRYGKTEWSAWSILATREWVANQGYAVASQYLSKTEASTTYLSITSAANLYHPKNGSASLNFVAYNLRVADTLTVGDAGAPRFIVQKGTYSGGQAIVSLMAGASENNDCKIYIAGQAWTTLPELRIWATETVVNGGLTASTLSVMGLARFDGNFSVGGNAFIDGGQMTIGANNAASANLRLLTSSAKLVAISENDTYYIESYTGTSGSGINGKLVVCGYGVSALTELRLLATDIIASGVIAPLYASTTDFGKSSTPWRYVYANRWYPNPNDTDHYIDYNVGVGAFRVVGNIYATGQVAAGGITIGRDTSHIEVIKIGADGTQYLPTSDGICTIPLISEIKVGDNRYTTNNGVCTLGLSWKIGNASFVIGNTGVIMMALTNHSNGSPIAHFGDSASPAYIYDIKRIMALNAPVSNVISIPQTHTDALITGDYIYASINGDAIHIFDIAGYEHSGNTVSVIYLQCGNMKRKLTHTSGNNYTYETNW